MTNKGFRDCQGLEFHSMTTDMHVPFSAVKEKTLVFFGQGTLLQ
jgi:hypothetical protein